LDFILNSEEIFAADGFRRHAGLADNLGIETISRLAIPVLFI